MRHRVERTEDERAEDERGSVLILTIGYALLALAVVLVGVDVTSLYLEQRRLDGIADAAALAGADGFTLSVVDGRPRAELSSQTVRREAESFLDASHAGVHLVSATSPDGRSARVIVQAAWHPPVVVPFAVTGLTIRSTATSRTELR
jgi:Flp pilus assembly protein TadG